MKAIWTGPLIGQPFKLSDIFYKCKGEKKYHFFVKCIVLKRAFTSHQKHYQIRIELIYISYMKTIDLTEKHINGLGITGLQHL